MIAAAVRWATWLNVPENILVVATLSVVALAFGSMVRLWLLRHAAPAERRRHLGSLSIWWGMLVLVLVLASTGRMGAAVIGTVVSWIGLREYFHLLDRHRVVAHGRMLFYLAAPCVHGLTAHRPEVAVVAGSLIVVVVLLTIQHVKSGTTKGYLASVSSLLWGYVIIVLPLAHLVLLIALPSSPRSPSGGIGWTVWLILFTELDDIFQALWGRQLGRHKITPVVSPGKSWEGLVLGGATAIAAGALLAPILTPMRGSRSVDYGDWSLPLASPLALLAGGLLCVVGFFGDLNFSALKRDVGVKDTGDWLPGQGGILDRIDSLLFTAPACYYFACWYDG